MSDPYDLGSGYKGFKALAAYEQIESARSSARHMRAMNASKDHLDQDAERGNALASELEQKAIELKKQMELD